MNLNIFKRSRPEETKVSLTPTKEEYNNIVKGNLFANMMGSNQQAINNSCIQRAVSAISNSCASIKAYEYRIINNTEKQRTYSQLDNILNIQVNPNMSAFQFKKSLIENAIYYGNAIVKINRTLDNHINSLELLNSNLLTCNYDQQKNTATYYYAGRDLSKDLDDFIIFFIYDSLQHNGTWGVSLAQYATETLKKSGAITSYQNSWFNGSSVTGILSPITPDRVQNTKKAEETKKQFINGSIDGVVFLDGEYKYDKLSVNSKDAALYELSVLNTSDLARVMNVPLEYFFVDKSTISEETRITFLDQTIFPILEKFETELQRKLYFKSDWNKYTVEFDYESVLKINKQAQADYFAKLFLCGGLSPNEIRSKINMPLSTEKLANELWTSQNTQPISANLNVIKQEKVQGRIDE